MTPIQANSFHSSCLCFGIFPVLMKRSLAIFVINNYTAVTVWSDERLIYCKQLMPY